MIKQNKERQLRAFATEHCVDVIGDESCPAMRVDIKIPHARENAKKLLEKLEEQNPRIFVSMRAAFENFHPNTFFAKESLDTQEGI